MRRSEYIKNLAQALTAAGYHGINFWHNVAQEAANAATAAGVVWDPEEPPLPERLIREQELVWNGAYEGLERRSLDLSAANLTPSEHLILAEAVRRYNAWPKLREIIDGADTANTYAKTAWLRQQILAILDGREERS